MEVSSVIKKKKKKVISHADFQGDAHKFKMCDQMLCFLASLREYGLIHIQFSREGKQMKCNSGIC